MSDNERLCVMVPHLQLKRSSPQAISPPAGLKPKIARLADQPLGTLSYRDSSLNIRVQARYLKLGDVLFRFSGFREKFYLGALLSICSIHLNFSLS